MKQSDDSGSKARGHKKQHFVPQSYLKAWCDPNTPVGQTPYVWVFTKDGANRRRRAPANIFHETDLYTIQRADGERDLQLEHGLAGLESAFVAIRDATLAEQHEIAPTERLILCAFVAAAHARTPIHRDYQVSQWAKVLDKMDRMKKWAETATPEQKRRAGAFNRIPGKKPGPRFGYEDVAHFVEKPMESMLRPQIGAETALLMRLDLVVLTSSRLSFITSDNPCVWFDAEGYKRPPMFQGPALMYESIEISLPVSPRQLILLNRRGQSGYVDVPEGVVDEYNRRTRFLCSEYFVGDSETTKPVWFDPGEEPEDSWRKLHPEPSTDAD